MDFRESPRVAALRETLHPFMEREVLPLEPALRRQGFVAMLPALAAARVRARETGLFAAHLPVHQGGGGLSLTEFACMSEALGRSPLGHYVFNCQAPDVGNMELLLEHGSPNEIARALRTLVTDGALRERFGRAAQAHARTAFDPVINARRVEAIYDELLAGTSAAPAGPPHQ